jgi:hypothetical protein
MKPNHEKKKTLPYTLNGFNAGIDLAFLVIGLTFGALKSIKGSNMICDLWIVVGKCFNSKEVMNING